MQALVHLCEPQGANHARRAAWPRAGAAAAQRPITHEQFEFWSEQNAANGMQDLALQHSFALASDQQAANAPPSAGVRLCRPACQESWSLTICVLLHSGSVDHCVMQEHMYPACSKAGWRCAAHHWAKDHFQCNAWCQVRVTPMAPS